MKIIPNRSNYFLCKYPYQFVEQITYCSYIFFSHWTSLSKSFKSTNVKLVGLRRRLKKSSYRELKRHKENNVIKQKVQKNWLTFPDSFSYVYYVNKKDISNHSVSGDLLGSSIYKYLKLTNWLFSKFLKDFPWRRTFSVFPSTLI